MIEVIGKGGCSVPECCIICYSWLVGIVQICLEEGAVGIWKAVKIGDTESFVCNPIYCSFEGCIGSFCC